MVKERVELRHFVTELVMSGFLDHAVLYNNEGVQLARLQITDQAIHYNLPAN